MFNKGIDLDIYWNKFKNWEFGKKAPGFEPDLPLPKQDKFNNLCDAGRLKVRGMPT